MLEVQNTLSYSITVFILVLITGCILNLLKRHFILQLSGIAFLLAFLFFRLLMILDSSGNLPSETVVPVLLPVLGSISACLISMVLGFWVFPAIRKRLGG